MLHIEPDGVQSAWRAGAEHAPDALKQAGVRIDDASGNQLADLAPATGNAAGHVLGALNTAAALLNETQSQLQACLADYAATDGASAGAFRALRGPGT